MSTPESSRLRFFSTCLLVRHYPFCIALVLTRCVRRSCDRRSLLGQLHSCRIRFRRRKSRNRFEQLGRKWIGNRLQSSKCRLCHSHFARVDSRDGDARPSSFSLPNDAETRPVSSSLRTRPLVVLTRHSTALTRNGLETSTRIDSYSGRS